MFVFLCLADFPMIIASIYSLVFKANVVNIELTGNYQHETKNKEKERKKKNDRLNGFD